MLAALLMIVMFVLGVFLILLVLIQRGRGGGLAGAFGGMGGQSAFGTKAGDLFTRITIVAFVIWILLQALAVNFFSRDESFDPSLGANAQPLQFGTDLSAAPGSSDATPPAGPSTATPLAETPAAAPASAPAAEQAEPATPK